MDYCLRATAANGFIRAFAATSKTLADKARILHQSSPTATAALGRALTAAAIMGLMAGNDEVIITISIKGAGHLGGLLAVSNGLGTVKGYTHNPKVEMPLKPNGKLDVGGAIGPGHITVIKDLGLKEPYIGKVELVSGEIAEDIASYFAISEQTPSVLSLGVLVDRDYSVKQAGGFLLQLMPGFDDTLIDKLEATMANFPPITSLLDKGKSPEDVLHELLSEFGYEITQKSPISYDCNCKKDRVVSALVAMGAAELKKVIEEDGKADINCHFCNKHYGFDSEELLEILESSSGNS